MIERSKSFRIGEKQFVVKFPNVGQIIEIESLKQALTNNKYGAMAQSGIVSMYYALDFVDAIAFLKICAPDVGRYYNIDDFTSVSPEIMEQFVKVYKEDIYPWYNGVMNELRNVMNDDDSKGNIVE